ncbi:hypothetical protein [Halobaculum rubrum]|uniref:hypothetical protein n=1 Tax=Halobaculum rubrum TaxID=2872158 RepID=UPI001CA3D679|nr:hypothetical protein [Halobaculum rubrum]QZX98980.1 hypothetical protein K6T25_12005 [Halobaculum rubrum]
MRGTALRLALLVVIVTGLSVGTTGFSAVEADRTVSVNVVENDEAYVGVVACEISNSNSGNGASPVRVWVTNRYTERLTVEEITSDDAVRTGNGQPAGGDLGPGVDKRFKEQFSSSVDTVTVAVTADGLDVTVTRTVAPKAHCPSATDDDSETTNTSTTTTGTATNTSE